MSPDQSGGRTSSWDPTHYLRKPLVTLSPCGFVSLVTDSNFLYTTATATDVENEELTLGYSGVLALAFPLNSNIAHQIPPTVGNMPDGAPISSNLFGLGDYGPREHYFTILLERPGMSRVPSVLGIGRHPSDILPDITMYGNKWESALQFDKVSMYQTGTLFWATPLTAITVYVNGTAANITTGASQVNLNSVDPIAVLDTGIPYIFGRVNVINAIYGAYGIDPGADGQCRSCSAPLIDSQPTTPFSQTTYPARCPSILPSPLARRRSLSIHSTLLTHLNQDKHLVLVQFKRALVYKPWTRTCESYIHSVVRWREF
jgi:hypothetical protein